MRKAGEWIHGKYQVERVLGSGGMGTVYATKRRNGSHAAVKVLHPRFAADKSIRARFLQEGFLANKVDHPAVVTILEDDIDEEGNFYLVMELLDGVDLGKFVGPPRTPIELSEALNITDRLLSVLVVAHQKGIVHRDIKPANIMLLRDGRIKLLDFGIAQVLNDRSARSEIDDDDDDDDDDLILGTDRFMSPEQGNGFLEEIDARSDLWSVGALLLALLADKEPNAVPLWDQNYEDRAWAFSRLGPVPPHIVQIISLALQPLRSRRWASAGAMQTAVHAAHEDLFGPPRREKLAQLAASKLSETPVVPSATTEPTINHSPRPEADQTQQSPRDAAIDRHSPPPPSSRPPGPQSIPARPTLNPKALVGLAVLLLAGVAVVLWPTDERQLQPKPSPHLPPPEGQALRRAPAPQTILPTPQEDVPLHETELDPPTSSRTPPTKIKRIAPRSNTRTKTSRSNKTNPPEPNPMPIAEPSPKPVAEPNPEVSTPDIGNPFDPER